MKHVVAKSRKKILISIKGALYRFKRYKGNKYQLAHEVCKAKCAVKPGSKRCNKVLIDHCEGGFFVKEKK